MWLKKQKIFPPSATQSFRPRLLPSCFSALPDPNLHKCDGSSKSKLIFFLFFVFGLCLKWKGPCPALRRKMVRRCEHSKYLKILLTRIYSCDHPWLQERLGNMTSSWQTCVHQQLSYCGRRGGWILVGNQQFLPWQVAQLRKHFSTVENIWEPLSIVENHFSTVLTENSSLLGPMALGGEGEM